MEFYTQDIVKEARNLKAKGVATKEITKKFGITRETLSRWCFDMVSTNSNHLRSQKIKEENRRKGEGHANSLSIDKITAKVLVALIYWCEGYKYPNCNCIGFANSDVNLVKTFLRLFRIGFNPKEEKLKVHLQIHDTHDKNEVTHFWSQVLNIPISQFYKPTITKPLLKMKRMDYKGTCTIRYYDVSLYQEISGTYEAFFKKVIRGEVA